MTAMGRKSAAKPSYLFVIASSSQMYSGTGTAIYDWIGYAKDHFEFAILIDTLHQTNFDHARDFCDRQGIELIGSSSYPLPGCPDSGVRGVADVLAQRTFDFVECVSWANAATNLAVLTSLGPGSRLLYTPHTQPLWTLGEPTRFPMVAHVFHQMLARSSAVFLDTPSEARLSLFDGSEAAALHVVPLGVDLARFRDEGVHRRNQLLCVCDCRETRKRVDLLMKAFELAYQSNPRLRLTLAGKGSEQVAVPAELKSAVTALGYIDEAQLEALYRECALFVLLSDFEAFGLPIAEALCSGAAVLLNEQDATRDLFSGLPGVTWVENTKTADVARLMGEIRPGKRDHARIARAAASRFNFDQTYGRKLEIVRSLLGDRHEAA